MTSVLNEASIISASLMLEYVCVPKLVYLESNIMQTLDTLLAVSEYDIYEGRSLMAS